MKCSTAKYYIKYSVLIQRSYQRYEYSFRVNNEIYILTQYQKKKKTRVTQIKKL